MKYLLFLVILFFSSSFLVNAHEPLPVADFRHHLLTGNPDVIFDIRSKDAFDKNNIGGSFRVIWNGFQLYNYRDKIPSSPAKIVVVSSDGVDAEKAADFLSKQGYTDVFYLEGGYNSYISPNVTSPQSPTNWGKIKTLFGNSAFRLKLSS